MLLRYIALVFLVFCSAFFSSAEIAYASVNLARLRSAERKSSNLAVFLACKIAENYNTNLSSILIGNNLVNIAASSIATVIVIDIFKSENYAWVSTVVMTVIILIFGEITPKVLAKQMPEKFSVIMSVPLYVVGIILKPVAFISDGIVKLVSLLWKSGVSDSDSVSEDDFENIIDIVEDEGVLDEKQCDLLQNALFFDEVLAYEVVTPRVDMEAIDIRDPYEVNIKKLLESTFSRIPVYEDTPDEIIGILHLNNFFKKYADNEKVSIRELLRPATVVHKTMPLPQVLEKMKQTKSHMVVVLDEYGGTFGILTMEDIFEQLVGEIFDESDEIEREFVELEEDVYSADGDMRVYDFFDEFDIDIDENEEFEGDTATIGGWVVSMLGGDIEEGAEIKFENLMISVLKTDGYRIERILVKEIEPEEADE